MSIWHCKRTADTGTRLRNYLMRGPWNTKSEMDNQSLMKLGYVDIKGACVYVCGMGLCSLRTEKPLCAYIRERYLWQHCNSAFWGTACLWWIEMQACKPRGLDNKFIALSEDAASPIIGFWPLLFSNNGDQLNGYVHCPQCRTSEEKSDAAPAPRMPCSYQPVHARIWTAGFTPECPLRSLSKNPLSCIRQS